MHNEIILETVFQITNYISCCQDLLQADFLACLITRHGIYYLTRQVWGEMSTYMHREGVSNNSNGLGKQAGKY